LTRLFAIIAILAVSTLEVLAVSSTIDTTTINTHPRLTLSPPINITGKTGVTISGLHITSTSGSCVTITSSTNITIKNSDIGPCGTNLTRKNSQGIHIIGSAGVNVYDSYIHVENLAFGAAADDTHDGILVESSSTVNIHGNVIAYGETNIEVASAVGSDHVSIIGNFLLNPRGPFSRGQNVQVYGAESSHLNTNITVSNNYTISISNTTAFSTLQIRRIP